MSGLLEALMYSLNGGSYNNEFYMRGNPSAPFRKKSRTNTAKKARVKTKAQKRARRKNR